MPLKFKPLYTITPSITKCVRQIEAIKKQVMQLPLTLTVLRSLRETARLYTTHYSTMIEGNKLDTDQIATVLHHDGHFPGRERDEKEVKGYYVALARVEKWAVQKMVITEEMVQVIHALVMGNGKVRMKPTPYRDGQNVIKDGKTKKIIYMPPEAKDVSDLMHALIIWIKESGELACPIIAAIAHYQYATIHPYYDGNGRTARLLTTYILHAGGYDLKGLYSLEEYYARDLPAYYQALNIGEFHNYYLGRAHADITPWIDYFMKGMVVSFEKVAHQMSKSYPSGAVDHSAALRKLDPRQRKVLSLFQEFDVVTSRQIGEIFGFKPRTISALCSSWAADGFLVVVDSSKKARKYALADQYRAVINT
jgi:Fic family protein